MNVVFDYSSSWYFLFFGFLLAWLALAVARRNRRCKGEVREQIFLGLGGMAALGLMEFFAVSTDLWHYTRGDWPLILWPTYFAAILFGYQLVRSIENVLLRRVSVRTI